MNLELISHVPPQPTFAPPLLFVHGAWHGAWAWQDRFLPHFAAQGFAAHALSLRAHGRSPSQKALRWIRAREYVADIAAVAQQFDTPPVLIGHSMGGFLVQKYLEQYFAPAAVLMAAVPPQGTLGTTLRIMRRHPLIFARVNLGMTLYPLVATEALARELLFSASTPTELVVATQNQLQDESYLGYLDMTALDLPRPVRVKTPMLVLGATEDSIISMDEVRNTAVSYHTQPHFFPMGHNMMIEPGWEQVADAIISWLQATVR